MRRVPAKERPDFFTLNPDSPLAQGLVAFYGGRFSGGDRYDDATESLWGGGNPGTLTNFADPGAAWGRENGRACVTFVSAYAQHIKATIGSLLIGTKTISLRVKTNAIASHAAFCAQWSSGLGRSFIAWHSSGTIYWGDYESTELEWSGGATAINDGAFHYLSFVRDGAGGSIYCDGTSKASKTTGFTDTASTDVLCFGAYNAGESGLLDGVMSDQLLHSRALSLDEIKALADPANYLLRIGATDLIRSVRRLHPTAVADTAKPWLYAARRMQIIGAGA